MINPKHLTSLVAIAEQGSFSAAGLAIGRSHSAISLHVKALEEELQTTLVERGARRAVLTSDGEALADHARRLQQVMDDIRTVGRRDSLAGRLAVGFVPTAMAHTAPPALAQLRQKHPDLGIEIRTGLSGELAQAVRSTELDAAVLTAPDLPPEDLATRPIASEPLVVIAPKALDSDNDTALLKAHPFIWFSRKTWAGQQIERHLLARRIRVRGTMEVDSLEAIEALVRHGLGVSIVPDTGQHSDGLHRVAFGAPQLVRQLALMTRANAHKSRLVQALFEALRASSTGNQTTG